MAYIEPTSKTDVYIPDAAEVNQLFDNMRALKAMYEERPYARLRENSGAGATDAVWNVRRLTELDVNEQSIVTHDPSTYRFTLQNGVYRMKFRTDIRGGRYMVAASTLYSHTNATHIGLGSSLHFNGNETADVSTGGTFGLFDLIVDELSGSEEFDLRSVMDFNNSGNLGYAWNVWAIRNNNYSRSTSVLEIWKIGSITP